MKRVKNLVTLLLGGLLIIGLGMISNACTHESPLGISLEDAENNPAQERPFIMGDPGDDGLPAPPPPPGGG